jgi:soluble lytic murein transglycosylase-like protein
MTRVALAIIGAALCLTAECGPARATTTEDAIAIACGPGHVHLAPMVDAAARRYMLDRVTLVALMYVESRCQTHAVSRRGAIGLLQVLPRSPAANRRTSAQLRDPAENIPTGARWLSLMTVWCGGLPAGLGAYNSGSCTKSRRFARHVLSVANRIWRELARRREVRS